MFNKNDERLGVIKYKEKIWKEHIEKIIKKENKQDQMVETDEVERPVERVPPEETVRIAKDEITKGDLTI